MKVEYRVIKVEYRVIKSEYRVIKSELKKRQIDIVKIKNPARTGYVVEENCGARPSS